MYDERNAGHLSVEAMYDEVRRLEKMQKKRVIDEVCVVAVASELRQIAIDTFGDKLDKLYLYEVNLGGREDYDMRFMIVLKVAHEDVNHEEKKLRAHPVDLSLKYDIVEYIQVTSSENFNKYKNSLLDYKTAAEIGVLLYG